MKTTLPQRPRSGVQPGDRAPADGMGRERKGTCHLRAVPGRDKEAGFPPRHPFPLPLSGLRTWPWWPLWARW